MDIFFCGYLNKIVQADKITIEYLDNQSARELKRFVCTQKNLDDNSLSDIWVIQSERLLYDDDMINPSEDNYLLSPILGG